jgi:hypothetical protein
VTPESPPAPPPKSVPHAPATTARAGASGQGTGADPPASRKTVGNNTKNNVAAPLRGGITGKGFLPGQSGNPDGRPKRSRELLTLVRDSTQDGRMLIDLLVRIVEGEPVLGHKPTLADMMRASEILLDRGWGRAIQRIDSDLTPVTVIVTGSGDVD